MNEKTLGKRLQEARQKAGLTQQELCQKAGLSYSTLAKIERGAIKSPSVFSVAAIAAACGSPLEELLGIELNSPTLAPAKKRSSTGVRFVYVDVNGVMVRFFHRAFSQIAEEAAIGADKVETLYWRHHDAITRGEESLGQFNALIEQELGINGFDWKKYYMANVEPIPHVDEFINWVAQHYQIGLLTNNMPGFTQELLSSGKIPNIRYDAIVDSSEVKTLKPETHIYEIAQQRAGVGPGEILLVDDERPNLMTADKLGWHVLLFEGFEPEESFGRARQALAFD